jgi:polysaccharide deacetylase family protein (PEP-CTERM system associated)
VNALTVDVEDYFQVSAFERTVARAHWDEFESRVVQNTERLLEILDQASVKATFFVLGWIAVRCPELVVRIACGGHEIASHGYDHRLIYDQTPAEFRDDIRRAKSELEATSGKVVLGYRAPSYSVTARSLWALDILGEEGFVYDASVFPIHHDRYGIPSADRHPHLVGVDGSQLLEIPASTVRVSGVNLPIAGGGYFRLFPYVWTEWGIKRVNHSEGQPVIFYLHPWEIDAGQPRLPGPWLSRFRHYRNLRHTEPRLRRLLSQFRFDTIETAILATKRPARSLRSSP